MAKSEILAVAKPILFNTEMVRRILDGTKTVTRRMVKGYALEHLDLDTDGTPIGVYDQHEGRVRPVLDFAPYLPGDILYVRETWRRQPLKWSREGGYSDFELQYRADFTDEENDCYGRRGGLAPQKWRPSIHMPKEAARIFLRVTGVKVCRLQDITEEQAIQEGIYQLPNDGGIDSGCWTYKTNPYENDPFGKVWSKDEGARNCFRWLWDGTLKPADRSLYGWDADPWVWVIEFEKMEVEK